MKNFIVFVVLTLTASYLLFLKRTENVSSQMAMRTLKVYSSSSFASQWGPGPELKQAFESKCQCRVDFIESSDAALLIQRMKVEGEALAADLVLGFDQFDVARAQNQLSWKKLDFRVNNVAEVQSAFQLPQFVPYDYSVLTFIVRKDLPIEILSLDDLLKPELKGAIALQDPRTSSLGLQFLNWVITIKGETEGFSYIQKLMDQVHSHSPSWSAAYGLFTNKLVKTVLSYVTSPLYHSMVEKDNSYRAVEFNEGHPMQAEFAAIPSQCQNCDLAEGFLQYMLSNEGQKIIMNKNFMFPVVKGVKEGTEFDTIPRYAISSQIQFVDSQYLEDLVKKWTEFRRNENK